MSIGSFLETNKLLPSSRNRIIKNLIHVLEIHFNPFDTAVFDSSTRKEKKKKLVLIRWKEND